MSAADDDILNQVRAIVADSLQLGQRADDMGPGTPLLGNLPELDSMAVVTVITAIEEHYGFFVDDDEITAETFSTLGTLADFVASKVNDA